jgi:hypothetical protein
MDVDFVRIEVSALCWSCWTSRNNIIFNKHKKTNFLQVNRRAAHWILQWVYLFPEVQWKLCLLGATVC